jgi:hypothetical protein
MQNKLILKSELEIDLPFYYFPLKTKVKRFRDISFIEKHILIILSNGVKTSLSELDHVLSKLLNVKQSLISELLNPYIVNDFIKDNHGVLNVKLDEIVESTKSENWKAKLAIEDMTMDLYYSDIFDAVFTKSQIGQNVKKNESLKIETKAYKFSQLEKYFLPLIDNSDISVNLELYEENNQIIETYKLPTRTPTYFTYSYDFGTEDIEIDIDSLKVFKVLGAQDYSQKTKEKIVKHISSKLVLPGFLKEIKQIPTYNQLNEDFLSNQRLVLTLEEELLNLDTTKENLLSSDTTIIALNHKIELLTKKIVDIKNRFNDRFIQDPTANEIRKKIADLELDINAYNEILPSALPDLRSKYLSRIQEVQKEISLSKQNLKEIERVLKEETQKEVLSIQSEVKELKSTKALLEKEINKEFEEKKRSLLKEKKQMSSSIDKLQNTLEKYNNLESKVMRDAFNNLIKALNKSSSESSELIKLIEQNRESIRKLYTIIKNNELKDLNEKREHFFTTLEIESLFNKSIPKLVEISHSDFEGYASSEAEIYQLMIENKKVCSFIDKQQKMFLRDYRGNFNVFRHEYSNAKEEVESSKSFLFSKFLQFYNVLEKLLTGFSKLI